MFKAPLKEFPSDYGFGIPGDENLLTYQAHKAGLRRKPVPLHQGVAPPRERRPLVDTAGQDVGPRQGEGQRASGHDGGVA